MKKLLLASTFSAAMLICGQAVAASTIALCDSTHQCITAASGNVANATVAATLAATPQVTNYLTGLHMLSAGATGALPVDCTITGIVGGTQTFTYVYSTLNAYNKVDFYYNPPLKASSVNTAIVASCPAGGTGAAHATMNLEGLQY